VCTLHPKTPHAHAYGPSTVDAFGVPLSDSAGIGDHNYCRNLRYPNTWSPINPEECDRTYSSVWDNDACGVGFAQSMLDSPQAWSGTIEGDIWMTIDAGSVMDVHGVSVQKRKDAPDQYVTQFTVQHSTDGASFSDVDGGAVFDGPTVANGADDYIDAEFAAPVSARYIRITVQEYNSHPSMRAGLLGPVTPASTTMLYSWDDPKTYNVIESYNQNHAQHVCPSPTGTTDHAGSTYTDCPLGSMMYVQESIAEEACAAIGGRLPILKSEVENQALFDFIRRLEDAVPSGYTWSTFPSGVHLGAGRVTRTEERGDGWFWGAWGESCTEVCAAQSRECNANVMDDITTLAEFAALSDLPDGPGSSTVEALGTTSEACQSDHTPFFTECGGNVCARRAYVCQGGGTKCNGGNAGRKRLCYCEYTGWEADGAWIWNDGTSFEDTSGTRESWRNGTSANEPLYKFWCAARHTPLVWCGWLPSSARPTASPPYYSAHCAGTTGPSLAPSSILAPPAQQVP
jgi:hypothetical protein